MSTSTVNKFYSLAEDERVEILLTPEHRAIESMMTMLKALPDYTDTNEFLDMCTVLDLSPAFDEFSKQNKVDCFTAAKLLTAAKFYFQYLKKGAEVLQ